MDHTRQEIVISGMGGCFPDVSNVGEWKQKLFNNEISIRRRWLGEYGFMGTIPFINRFDHQFFGIRKGHVDQMDPQLCMLLERTFEALLDAGVNPNSVKGKKIASFFAVSQGENDTQFLWPSVYGHSVIGYAKAMLANRISYWLNLKGPSVSYDCNWISGFEIIRSAYNAIQRGTCESAIIGVSSIALFQEFQKNFADMGLISPDGSTKAFDANANGYTRSDGVVVLYIQKACDAKRSYGSIVHVDTRFYGNSEKELIKIDKDNMVEFLEDFYQVCSVSPNEIDYLETYGCGVKEVDRAELDAIESVYCKDRPSPLLIGSVKTQSGHAEACAPLLSLVKVLIAMEEDVLPATLQFETPNSQIQGFCNKTLEVVTSNREWKSKYAAVNCIGIDNYYGHIVIKQNLKTKSLRTVSEFPVFLPISSRTEESIEKIFALMKDKPYDPEFHRLVQDVFSTTIPNLTYKGYCLLGKEIHQEYSHQRNTRGQVWFVYSGMGSQWPGMISDFLKIPVFAESIWKCHNILSKYGLDLLNILRSDDKTLFENILNCFTGIASIQIALTDLLNSIGIVPDGIIGHSVGELGCGYADGCLTAEQMLLSAYYRGLASLESTVIRGKMAAIGLGYKEIKDQLPSSIDVACHNSEDSTTISGPEADLREYVKKLTDKGIFARLVNTADIAYHSRYVKPIAPILKKYLLKVIPDRTLRSDKWISTSNEVHQWNTDMAKYCSADYYTNNLLSSVFFEEGIKYVPADSILIEIAPHALLQAILKRSAGNCTNIPLANKNSKSGVEFLLHSLGKLYMTGVDLNIAALYPKIEYPVSRATPSLSDLVGWNHTIVWPLKVVGCERSLGDFGVELEINFKSEHFKDLLDHKIENHVFVPVSTYLKLLLRVLDINGSFILENLYFKNPLVIPTTSTAPLRVVIQRGSGEFEFWSDQEILLVGKVTFLKDQFPSLRSQPDDDEKAVSLNDSDFYNELKHRGYTHTGVHRMIRSLSYTDRESMCTVRPNEDWTLLVDAMIQQKVFFSGEKYQDIKIPDSIDLIQINTGKIKKQEVVMAFDFSTKIISTEQLRIRNVILKSWKPQEKKNCLEFVSCIDVDKTSFKKVEEALEFTIKLSMRNSAQSLADTLLISTFADDKPLKKELRIAINYCPYINIQVTEVSRTDEIFINNMYPQLVIVHDEAEEQLLELVSIYDVFLLCKRSHFTSTYPGLVEMARIEMNIGTFSIMRKINNNNFTVKDITDWHSNNYSNNFSSGVVSQLNMALVDVSCENVILKSAKIPAEGYEKFFENIRKDHNMKNVKFLFNLDKQNQDLTAVYERNLILSIAKNGSLHTVLPLSFIYENSSNSIHSDNRTDCNSLIKYLSLIKKEGIVDFETSDTEKCGTIDYSGITNNGKRVMGIAHVQPNSLEIELDPILSWEIPENWTLEDGVTTPYAYISSFYLLIIKAKLQPGLSVFIQAGCTAVGLAAINIANCYNCKVFTTVSSKTEKIFLTKYYCLDESNIFVTDDSSFYSDLMYATNGQGAQIILNCYSGSILKSALECCAPNGTIVHYGGYNRTNDMSIYMSRFLKSISLLMVDLQDLHTWPKETKQKIWGHIAEGLQNRVIRPLRRNCLPFHDISDLFRHEQYQRNPGKIVMEVKDSFPENDEGSKYTRRQFKCYATSCYAIFGDSPANSLDIAEWLVYRGAVHISISVPSKILRNDLRRRISLLEKYFNTNVTLFTNQTDNADSIEEFIQKSRSLGPIDTVFLMPTQRAPENLVKYRNELTMLEGYLRKVAPKSLVVNFCPHAVEIYQSRLNDGFRSYNIQSTDKRSIKDTIKVLDDILISNCSHAVTRSDTGGSCTFIDMQNFLPSLEEIILRQKCASAEPNLLQVVTNGPVVTREVAPVFIITDLIDHTRMEKTYKELVYPTYCTVHPSIPWPMEKLAEVYAEKIEAIYSNKVYNLIGFSTGSILMIEVAKELQKRKPDAELNVFFIDNDPTIIQTSLQQLGEDVDLEVNILRSTLRIHDLKLLKEIREAPNWNARLNLCLANMVLDKNKTKTIESGLNSLKYLIDGLKRHIPKSQLVSGKVHVIRSSNIAKIDIDSMRNYFTQQPVLKLIDGEHLRVLSHPETIEYLNFFIDV